jgi:hypothetical protein
MGGCGVVFTLAGEYDTGFDADFMYQKLVNYYDHCGDNN